MSVFIFDPELNSHLLCASILKNYLVFVLFNPRQMLSYGIYFIQTPTFFHLITFTELFSDRKWNKQILVSKLINASQAKNLHKLLQTTHIQLSYQLFCNDFLTGIPGTSRYISGECKRFVWKRLNCICRKKIPAKARI